MAELTLRLFYLSCRRSEVPNGIGSAALIEQMQLRARMLQSLRKLPLSYPGGTFPPISAFPGELASTFSFEENPPSHPAQAPASASRWAALESNPKVLPSALCE